MYRKILLWGALSLGLAACQSPSSTTAPTHLTAQWARGAVTGPGASYLLGTAADSTGNLYVVGSLAGSGIWDFGNDLTFITDSSSTAVLIKYSAAGAAQWVQAASATSSSDSTFAGITIDAAGHLDVCGYISGTATYGFGNSVSAAGPDGSNYNAVLVQYDSSGTAQWASTLTAGTGYSFFRSAATDASNDIYVVGSNYAAGTYNYGNGATASAGSSTTAAAVIVKYSSTGVAQWARTQGTAGVGYNQFMGVAVDSGAVYAVGSTTGTAANSFGNGVTTTGSSTGNNLLLVKYDSSGNAQWAQTTASGSGMFASLAIDGAGNLYVVGSADAGTVGLGSGVTVTAGGSATNALLVKYNSAGTAQWAASLTSGSNSALFNGIAFDAAGNLAVVGEIDGNAAFGFGHGVTATGSSVYGNVVIAQYSTAGIPLRARSFTSGSGTTSAYFQGVAATSSGRITAVGTIDEATYGLGNGVTVTGTDTTTGNAYNGVVVSYTD